MGKRQREWARKERVRLIELLGGVCVDCGATDRLEFDHREPRTWVNKHHDPSARMSKIRAEIARGIIELRCPDCNKRKGKPKGTPRPPGPDVDAPF